MTYHPNETPEPLPVVAWRKHLSGAEWKVADYVLLDSEELVRLSDAAAALQSKDAEIAGLKADAGRYAWCIANTYESKTLMANAHYRPMSKSEVDQAIDAAIRAQTGGEHD